MSKTIDLSRLPPECDSWCRHRKCLNSGEDKGVYSQGRGYTSYHKGGPKHVCMTRHCNGCPSEPVVRDGESHGFRPLPDLKSLLAERRKAAEGAKFNPKAKLVVRDLLTDLEQAVLYLDAFRESAARDREGPTGVLLAAVDAILRELFVSPFTDQCGAARYEEAPRVATGRALAAAAQAVREGTVPLRTTWVDE